MVLHIPTVGQMFAWFAYICYGSGCCGNMVLVVSDTESQTCMMMMMIMY